MRDNLELKAWPFEVKEVDFEASTFEGYSAGIGNLDKGNDEIQPGAFKKTIRERVGSGKVKWLDQHAASNIFGASTESLWGRVLEAEEIELDTAARKELARRMGAKFEETPTHALFSKIFASRTTAAQEALTKISENNLDALSIGYIPIKVEYEKFDNGKKRPGGRQDPEGDNDEDPRILWLLGRAKRKIKEAAWWETSSVIWGMNPAALVLPGTVKALIDVAEEAARGGIEVPQEHVRELVEALQKLGGCSLPQVAETSLLLPKIEELHARLDEIKLPSFIVAIDRLEELTDVFLAQAPAEAAGVKEFVAWTSKKIEADLQTSTTGEKPEAKEGEEPTAPELDGSSQSIDSEALAASLEEMAGKVRALTDADGAGPKQVAGETPPGGRPVERLPEEELDRLKAERAALELVG